VESGMPLKGSCVEEATLKILFTKRPITSHWDKFSYTKETFKKKQSLLSKKKLLRKRGLLSNYLILNRLFIEGTESLYPQQTVYRGD
jgi:hypothetical protein